jgi:hypothetical protein
MTFEDVELRVVQDLKQRIVSGAGANMDVVHALIARRRDGHWANPCWPAPTSAPARWRLATTR